jgi:hypothetical protein
MTYDVNGNLLSFQEQGFAGSTAISRITVYVYNGYGQIVSIDGLRANDIDVDDTAAFTYYPNEAGQGHNRGQLQTTSPPD